MFAELPELAPAPAAPAAKALVEQPFAVVTRAGHGSKLAHVGIGFVIEGWGIQHCGDFHVVIFGPTHEVYLED
jgi:hypothetical protein